MDAFSEELEVISITRAEDMRTGKPIFSIALGRSEQVGPEVKARLSRGGQAVAGEYMGINVLLLTAALEGSVPYRAGSKWRMEIRPNGELTLKEVANP